MIGDILTKAMMNESSLSKREKVKCRKLNESANGEYRGYDYEIWEQDGDFFADIWNKDGEQIEFAGETGSKDEIQRMVLKAIDADIAAAEGELDESAEEIISDEEFFDLRRQIKDAGELAGLNLKVSQSSEDGKLCIEISNYDRDSFSDDKEADGFETQIEEDIRAFFGKKATVERCPECDFGFTITPKAVKEYGDEVCEKCKKPVNECGCENLNESSVIPASEGETVLTVPGFRVVQEESGFTGADDEILELVVERDEDGEGRFIVDPVAQDITLQVHELNDKENYFFDLNKTREGFEIILTTETSESSDGKFNYQLLDRLRQDCEYFLGNGNRANKHLWAGSPEKQIAKMRELYEILPEKPEWLTAEEIDEYERKMLGESMNEAVAQFVEITDPMIGYAIPKDLNDNFKEKELSDAVSKLDYYLRKVDDQFVVGQILEERRDTEWLAEFFNDLDYLVVKNAIVDALVKIVDPEKAEEAGYGDESIQKDEIFDALGQPRWFIKK